MVMVSIPNQAYPQQANNFGTTSNFPLLPRPRRS